ncbi:MAG: efflux RND transporter permease subunit [Deltaproteobacteria bacterium]|nr:efflux RND transporter permease subunit [Deltaproteobacteria bacterium]
MMQKKAPDRYGPFFPVERPVAVLMMVAAVLVFGYFSFKKLPVALMPDISYPTITVRTTYPGAAPEEVESEVTKPIEEVLSTVGGLIRMESISRAEVSDVVLEFTWSEDVDKAARDIREQLDLVPFADEIERPLILRYDPALDPVMRVGIFGDMDLYGLRLYAEEEIAPALESVDGVAVAKVRGGLEREVRISLDEGRIASLGLTSEWIVARLKAENINLAGGRLKEGQTEYLVRTLSEFKNLDEIRQVVITVRNGAVIRLGEIAKVEETHKDREVITRIDGKEAVEVAVYREADANLVKVAQRVRDKIFGTSAQQKYVKYTKADSSGTFSERVKDRKKAAAMAKLYKRMTDFLVFKAPAGLRMTVLSDQSRFVTSAVGEVESAMILGGLLAVLVLYMFLKSSHATWVVGLSIPISVVATFAPMYLFGVSLNVMSLGGLALGVGMLVDNAIVVLESIQRCMEEGDEPIAASVRGSKEVLGAITASTLTTVAVFFPIVFVEGVAGQIFGDLSMTVVFSLLASLGTAAFFVPMMTARKARADAQKSGAGAEKTGGSLWLDAEFRSLHVTVQDLASLKEKGIAKKIAGYVYYVLRFLILLPLELLFGKIIYISAVMLARGLSFLAFRVLGEKVLANVLSPLVKANDIALSGLRKSYPRLLAWSLDNRGSVLAIAFLMFLGAMWALSSLGAELIPEVAQGEFTLEAFAPIGTPLRETARRVAPIERMLKNMDEVEAVTSVIGLDKSDYTKSGKGEHTADIMVRLAGADELGKLGLDTASAEDRVIGKLRRFLLNTPGLDGKISRPTLFSFRTPLEVEIKGHDLALLRKVASKVYGVLKDQEFLQDLNTSVHPGHPEVRITYKRERLAYMGLSVAEVAREVRNKVQGNTATHFTRGDRRYDVVVRLNAFDRSNLQNLKMLTVGTRNKKAVPLAAVADVKIVEGPAEIRRIDTRRAADITSDVSRGVDLASAAQKVRSLLSGIKLPADFSMEVTGQDQEMERSLESLWIALALAIFLVYVVMASTFESLFQPFVILFTLPLAAAGAGFALYIGGWPLSVFVLLGFIVLAGIVVNDAIVLVDYVNQLRARGFSRRDALLRAGPVRLRPILITTVTTVLGLLPMALGIGEGSELRQPMAVVVMAGLTSATLLTLVVIPVVYDLFDSILSRRSSRKRPSFG